MDCPTDKIAELEQLIWQLRDGAISAEGVRRIESLVAGDAAARRFYIRHGMLCGGLRWMKSGGEGLHACGHWPDASGRKVESGEWRVESEKQRPKTQDLRPDFPNPQIPTIHSSLSTLHSWAVSYAVATLLLGIALLGAWFSTITHPDADSLIVNANSRRVTPSGGTDNKTHQFTFVGKVSGLLDCQWADPKTETVAGAAVELGRRYALRSGLLEISYDSGARVILQGPCDYTVESRSSGYLRVGKLVAKVESQESRVESKAESGKRKAEYSQLSALDSRLFAVRTPTATVEDLGTEFGVKVSDDGETASHVFAGQVVMRAEGRGERGEGRETDSNKSEIINHKSEILLSAGQSAKVTPGENKVRSTSAASSDANNFVRAMPPSRVMQDSQGYEKLVLALDPTVYFRMENPRENKGQSLFDSAPGGHHGQIRLGDNHDGSPFAAGRFGTALRLRGPVAADYAIVPDYPKAADKLTVSAWVFAAGRTKWAMIAANWGHTVEGQFHLGSYWSDGDLSACVRQRDGERIVVREGFENPLPTFRWQHVAMVADGAELRLYRNGRLAASAPCDGLYAETPLTALGIGCATNDPGIDPLQDTHGVYPWLGRIDELAIFNRALAADEIIQLATPRTSSHEEGKRKEN